MKNFAIAAVALLMLAAAVPAKAQQSGDLSVYFNYLYSGTSTIDSSGNFPACVSAVKSCVSGFNIYDVTSGRVKLGSINNPAGASGSIQVTGDLTLTNVAYGTHSIVATAAYYDGNGDPGESADSLPGTFQVPTPQAKATGAPTAKFTPK